MKYRRRCQQNQPDDPTNPQRILLEKPESCSLETAKGGVNEVAQALLDGPVFGPKTAFKNSVFVPSRTRADLVFSSSYESFYSYGVPISFFFALAPGEAPIRATDPAGGWVLHIPNRSSPGTGAEQAFLLILKMFDANSG